MKKYILFLSIFVLLMTAGCSAPQTVAPGNQGGKAGSSGQALNVFKRDLAHPYNASFTIQFEGERIWTYTLDTRQTAELSELSLHIEGIEGTDNPGDIRLVTDGKTSRVTGAGTDNQCLQFPSGQGMDPQWIFPESLLSLQDLNTFLTYTGEEDLSGEKALHFSGKATTVSDWKDVKAEIWQDKSSRGLLRFTLEGQVEDPYFGAGAGRLNARYEASDAGATDIEPVSGCEISAPLPKDANHFVRLPGIASFNTKLSLGDVQQFYQERLPQEGWSEKEVPALDQGSAVLSYSREGEELEIHITAGDSGSEVELLFLGQ